jgi:hypothetical protein
MLLTGFTGFFSSLSINLFVSSQKVGVNRATLGCHFRMVFVENQGKKDLDTRFKRSGMTIGADCHSRMVLAGIQDKGTSGYPI